jgi:hypothetical protein
MDIIDKTLNKGYDGMFLDNIDNYTIFGPQKDQRKELVTLLRNIKEKYPKKEFIQNAALDLIAETSAYVDAVAIESVASLYDFKTKKYGMRDNKQFDETMTRLKNVNANYKMPIILIEYADTKKLQNKITEKIKPSGFQYFIGNINLQHLPKFK